jgi:hypothetical protein
MGYAIVQKMAPRLKSTKDGYEYYGSFDNSKRIKQMETLLTKQKLTFTLSDKEDHVKFEWKIKKEIPHGFGFTKSRRRK